MGERRVHAVIPNITRSGDCVWDVGADVGFYSLLFLERVGPTGQVIAFEPLPMNAAELRTLAPAPQLVVVEAALADSDGQTSFVNRGGMSCIGESPDGLTVRMARGDTLIEEGIQKPDVVKIDVEGFEGEVLDGLQIALQSVRSVVVEMHFAALAQRGIPEEPMRIVDLFRDQGFAVRWIDTSHLLANRER